MPEINTSIILTAILVVAIAVTAYSKSKKTSAIDEPALQIIKSGLYEQTFIDEGNGSALTFLSSTVTIANHSSSAVRNVQIVFFILEPFKAFDNYDSSQRVDLNINCNANEMSGITSSGDKRIWKIASVAPHDSISFTTYIPVSEGFFNNVSGSGPEGEIPNFIYDVEITHL